MVQIVKGEAKPDDAALSRSASQTDTPAFKKWFGDSQVVDENGRPLVVYHGTKADVDFSKFNTPSHFGTADQANSIIDGFRFGAPAAARGDGDRVMPVYLSIQNPAYIYDTGGEHVAVDYVEAVEREGYLGFDETESIKYDVAGDLRDEKVMMKKFIAALKNSGYDGFAYSNQVEGEGASWVPFSPKQIKSAIGNRGHLLFQQSRHPLLTISGSQEATSAGTATPSQKATPAAPPIRERMERVIDTLIYNFQDRFKPLKDIQKRAGLVPEAEDAALAEERYSGKVRARTDEFEAGMREPLIKAIHESGVEYDDVEEYLHALHAPSRNAAMREINLTEQELKDKVDALTTQRDALANDADVAEYLKLRRELR